LSKGTKLPDTCECELDLESKTLIHQCRTHKNFRDSMQHNLSFKDKSEVERETEKRKPEFRRR